MCHKFISALFIIEIIMLSNSSCVKAAEENYNWNCQEMCSRRIPKILDRQISGSVMRQPC